MVSSSRNRYPSLTRSHRLANLVRYELPLEARQLTRLVNAWFDVIPQRSSAYAGTTFSGNDAVLFTDTFDVQN